jgi:hypothetical protein
MKWDFAFRPKWGGMLKIFKRHNAFQDAAASVTAGCAAFAITPGVKPMAGTIAP